MPTRSDDYQLPSWPKTKLDPALWNAVMADIAARLKARELLEASFELLQEQGIQAALDYIQVSIAPQLVALQQAIANAQATIDEILGGNAPNAQKLGGQLPSYYASAQALADGLATKVDSSTLAGTIQQSIAALVNSSPAALDTLSELAAALGNDPNFATTMTNALAAKAMKNITISGSGLATGGGDLSANRALAVPKSTNAQALAGTDDATAMTPVRTKEAIAALTPPGLGTGQSWQSVSRALGTNYQNTTGKPIVLFLRGSANSDTITVIASVNASAWVLVGSLQNYSSAYVVIPNGWFYNIQGSGSFGAASELR